MASCCWSIIIELSSVYSIIMASSSNIIQAMSNIILEDEDGGIAIEAVEGGEKTELAHGFDAKHGIMKARKENIYQRDTHPKSSQK
uniref:Uncharacterized protein n=1 Tax=Daucus carota subsp. sativus TaxID=79200 RepID=A0A166F7I0_DAUCS